MGFSQQEYWRGLPFPSPGNLPDPGWNPSLLPLLHGQADSLPLYHLGSTIGYFITHKKMWLKQKSLFYFYFHLIVEEKKTLSLWEVRWIHWPKSAGFEFRLIDTVFFFLSIVLLSHSFIYHGVKEFVSLLSRAVWYNWHLPSFNSPQCNWFDPKWSFKH